MARTRMAEILAEVKARQAQLLGRNEALLERCRSHKLNEIEHKPSNFDTTTESETGHNKG